MESAPVLQSDGPSAPVPRGARAIGTLREVAMRFLVIGDDATLEEIEEAIGHLRTRQQRAVIASTVLELQADIDELLDMLIQRRAPIAPDGRAAAPNA